MHIYIDRDEYEIIRSFEKIYQADIANRDRIGSYIWELLHLEEKAPLICQPSWDGTWEFEINVSVDAAIDDLVVDYCLKVFYDPFNEKCNWKYVFVLNPYEALPK